MTIPHKLLKRFNMMYEVLDMFIVKSLLFNWTLRSPYHSRPGHWALTSEAVIKHVTSVPSNKTMKLTTNRKVVLTINPDKALRSINPQKTTSLLYQDYDKDGKLLNSVYMYNLADVAIVMLVLILQLKFYNV
ncbi:unnamed protein product [Leptidea sinapis]|uniref:Uncharacterized protein n=1 Tax=Leptidea sinapis TaxID=189913 RepID=A0A5E4QIW9_9NEOP|nr:unnamed protein product [Leptidea sinapis]